MDFSRSLLFFVFFSLISSSLGAAGLSKEKQAQLLESLQNYKQIEGEEKIKGDQQQANGAKCHPREAPKNSYCLEKKYISGDYFIVRVAFEKMSKTPTQPNAEFIRENGVLRKDLSRRKAFLRDWSDQILREYVGKDYQKFNSAELEMVNSRVVVVKLTVLEATELTELLANPRVVLVRHIGNPDHALEDVAN